MCAKKETLEGFDELLEGFQITFDGDETTKLHLKAGYFWGGHAQVDATRAVLAYQNLIKKSHARLKTIFCHK